MKGDRFEAELRSRGRTVSYPPDWLVTIDLQNKKYFVI